MIGVQICSNREWRAVWGILEVEAAEVVAYPLGGYFRRDFAGREWVFYHSGPTKTRAAAACQYAIDHWLPECVMVLGTCGAVARDLAVGDVVLANRTVQYDCIERMDPPEGPFFEPMVTVIDPSWFLTESVAKEVKVGTVGTADQDLTPEAAKQLRGHGVLAVDWESGAIAKVCELNGVRCAILRGVTDFGGGAGGEDYRKNTPVVMAKLLDLMEKWAASA